MRPYDIVAQARALASSCARYREGLLYACVGSPDVAIRAVCRARRSAAHAGGDMRVFHDSIA